MTVHPDAIDRTVHKTHEWLKGIGSRLHDPDQRAAYHALRAVLHALRDRLSVEHVVGFGAQLPMLVRGIFYEGWHPQDKPRKIRDAETFEAMIQYDLMNEGWPGVDAGHAAVAVFRQLEVEMDHAELEKVVQTLPLEVRAVLGVGSAECGEAPPERPVRH